MKNITKKTLASLLQEKLGFSGLLCEEIVTEIFTEMLNLALADRLVLTNFGKFQVYSKNARPGMNLQTGKKLKITSRKVLRFHATKSFKEKVNSDESRRSVKY